MPRDPRRDTAPRTLARRGPSPLTQRQTQDAKQLRDIGWSFAKIAAVMPGKSPSDVRIALASTRSRHADPRRVMIGAKPDQLAPFNAFALRPDAPRHETLDEVLRLARIGQAFLAAFRGPDV